MASAISSARCTARRMRIGRLPRQLGTEPRKFLKHTGLDTVWAGKLRARLSPGSSCTRV